MCSLAGDIEDASNCTGFFDSNIDKELLIRCKKCPQKSIILLQKKDPFCKLCFFEYCNHKYRSTIGKSKKVKHGDKVLLACSGGRKSAALLHMTMQTIKSASMKQISFSPAVIFINDSFLDIPTVEQSTLDISCILKQFKTTNYPVLYSSLEMVSKLNNKEEIFMYLEDDLDPSILSLNDDLKQKMNESFKEIDLTSKVDLLRHYRLLLITEIAYQAGYNSVFLGDTATALAIELLSDIALGRGSQISSDTSFYDTRFKVPVFRPLREFLNKEVALYNHLHCTVYNVFPDFLTKTSSNSCIQRLTETFLSTLQEDFPATIFTVFRTGGKLSKNNTDFDSKICIVCRSEVDNINPDPCSALEALKISQRLSSFDTFEPKEKSIDLLQYVCHGCSRSLQNMSQLESLHSLMPEVSFIKTEKDAMKGKIASFLIDEDS